MRLFRHQVFQAIDFWKGVGLHYGCWYVIEETHDSHDSRNPVAVFPWKKRQISQFISTLLDIGSVLSENGEY